MTAAPASLQVQDLCVQLHTEEGLARAVERLSLTVAQGQTFALVGESGCGKSMTAMALLRLLPDNGEISRGVVALRDMDVMAQTERQMQQVRGRRIAIIFQEPATSLNPVMRVGEQLLEVLRLHTPLRGAAARQRALDWLHRVGLPEPERRFAAYPFELSGGQLQRVMIAMALAAEPDVLIADEPTTALDVSIQAQILALLQALQRERGMALLLITHDLAVVQGMAHQVALMYAGQIVETASSADFFARPQHPYARLLLQAVPGQRLRGQALAAIEGTVPPLTQTFAGCRFAPRCPQRQPECERSPVPLLDPMAAWTGEPSGEPSVDRSGARSDGRSDARTAVPSGGHAVRCLWPADRRPPQAMDALRTAVLARADTTEVEQWPSDGPHDIFHESFHDSPPDRSQAPESDPVSTTGVAQAVPLLSVQDLSVDYALGGGWFSRPRVFAAVRGVSLAIGRGETLALVGESGCGKTTLGKALLRLLQGRAQVRGQAWLGDVDLLALRGQALHQARRQLQIVFQNPFASLNPRLRVQDLIEEGMRSLRPEWSAAERQQRLRLLLDQVGLPVQALQRFAHEFSGGQRQRIAIARALAVQPALIVCDEPTSALDVSVQAQILNLLRHLQRELGVSYLFITHNIGVVEYLADRVAVMQAGLIVESGPARAVLGRPQQAYTRALLQAVPRLREA